MRTEALYLRDIVEAAEAIDIFLIGVNRDVPELRHQIVKILEQEFDQE